ncbi:DsrE/DsrF/DrsH-like family protein [Brevibacillus composti]|uniref:DsrE/DsrF/DrsH-like family protein n=1 Tax=Brevibacillus composti TaxID=2796470 RepID=A0A7T5JN20_9BACL|nr:DsrE/DsrF/DrsH-like family protein [Brevibacillus composti]QQE73993.1 DsrE/DsrF/DrsH-like family protein [Brevibacillus composti]QUO41077.1 DsrE/DsrF/DrsH-like family protein [Brevibacillus composti]
MANKRVAIIASSAGLETAYKVLNIATAAAALDAEVGIFFTFEGLSIIHKNSEQMLQLKPENAGLTEGFKKANVPTIGQLLEIAKESGVRMIACQMTVDVMGLDKEDFIDGIELGGAAAYLDYAFDAQVTLHF